MNDEEEKRRVAIQEYGSLAGGMLMLGMAYEGLKPMLDGNPNELHSKGLDGFLVDDLSPIADFIPWPLLAGVLCFGFFTYNLLKLIPRRSVYARRERVEEDSDWADVSQENSFDGSRQDPTHESRWNHGLGED